MGTSLFPGLSEAAHTFYTLEGAVRLRDALKDFRGGRIVLTGDRHAVRGEGSFFTLPHPQMSRRVPDVMQYEEKLDWVQDWVKENLG